jgi:hypothetical protein
MDRTDWDDLPEGVRTAVEAHTGPVTHAKTASEGLNSALAAFLYTPSGTVFVKGLHRDHRQVVSQQREAMIAPYVLAVSPRLLWQVEVDGWNVLGFEYIEGRHADYTPGSADLPKVIDAMRLLDTIPCPDLPLKRAEQRWVEHVDDAAALELLAGDSLLHTDWNPVNVLISDGTARIIDWAWPTRGAGWVDPACLVVRLMAAGHTPREAEDWARQVPAWNTASTEAVDTFASAACRMWAEIAEANPAPWTRDMAAAAQGWTEYRLAGRSGGVSK